MDNGVEVNMADDYEEGEIRACEPPDDGRNNLEGEQVSPEVGESPVDNQSPGPDQTNGNDLLHGDEERSVHIPREDLQEKYVHGEDGETVRFPRENDDLGTDLEAAPETYQDNILTGLDEHIGPNNTPGFKKPQLGKRDRNVRSPPSVGSVQGNATRPRHRSEDTTEGSIDLNRPGSNQGSPTQPRFRIKK
ncbi:hypothetical protein Hanom_Chr07g00669291 [Helianthus anomalus]